MEGSGAIRALWPDGERQKLGYFYESWRCIGPDILAAYNRERETAELLACLGSEADGGPRCESCGAPSDGYTLDEVPLCKPCGEALNAETMAEKRVLAERGQSVQNCHAPAVTEHATPLEFRGYYHHASRRQGRLFEDYWNEALAVACRKVESAEAALAGTGADDLPNPETAGPYPAAKRYEMKSILMTLPPKQSGPVIVGMMAIEPSTDWICIFRDGDQILVESRLVRREVAETCSPAPSREWPGRLVEDSYNFMLAVPLDGRSDCRRLTAEERKEAARRWEAEPEVRRDCLMLQSKVDRAINELERMAHVGANYVAPYDNAYRILTGKDG